MVTATAAALLLLLPAAAVSQTPGVRKIGPKGGGACASATDCQLAGECKDSKCSCDPGWTGPLCSMLDLAPLPAGFSGGACVKRCYNNEQFTIYNGYVYGLMSGANRDLYDNGCDFALYASVPAGWELRTSFSVPRLQSL